MANTSVSTPESVNKDSAASNEQALPPVPKQEKTQAGSNVGLKGGVFLTKKTNADSIFIPEEWNDEQRMIADMVSDFCKMEIEEPIMKRGYEFDASKELDLIEGQLRKAAELGLCGLSISEKHGGLDLDFNTGLLFSEYIAAGFSFATTIGAQTSIGSLPIVYYGTEAQKDKYLPGIATADLIASYALTEPTAGSDANSGKTSAKLNAEGTHYLINGQKMWITNGGFADLFIVFAKIDDDEKLSAFIVEKAFGGITLGKEERKLGIKGSSTVQVFFNDCPVPADNLLAKRGEGFKIALNILNTGRIKLAAGGVGGAKYATSRGIKYAIERKQFDKSIASFGAIKYKIGDAVMRTFALESAVYRTGRNIDLKYEAFKNGGMSQSEAKLKAVREFAIECALLKVNGSELACNVIDEVLQIHGGMGYSAELGIEMGWRDARITRIYEGTNEINRLLSVAELMKRAYKTKEIDLMGPTKSLPFHIAKTRVPFKSGKGLDTEERIVDNFKKAFLLISGAAGRKLKLKLVDEQEIIMCLSDILGEAYIAESLLLRVQKLQNKQMRSKEEIEVLSSVVRLYLYEALDKVRKQGHDAIAAYADGLEQSMMHRMLDWLTPRYDVNAKELRRQIANHAIAKQEYPF